MTLLYAPDSYSGFLSAPGAIRRALEVWEEAGLQARGLPLADGGEGTTLTLLSHLSIRSSGEKVTGPAGGEVHVPLCHLPGGLFIETARVVGKTLLPESPSPMTLSSYGLGELLDFTALRHDEPIILGLGGSATMDAGLGMAQGLGLSLLDAAGRPLPSGATAADLSRVAKLVGPAPLEDRVVWAWADVETPLLDSAALFGPQKGASMRDIAKIQEGLKVWMDVVNQWREGQGLPPVDGQERGMGAAGGLGFALRALLDAVVTPGTPALARLLGLGQALEGVEVLVTGEGCVDASSFRGKVVGYVVAQARAAGVREVGVIAGQLQGELPSPPAGPDWVVVCEDFEGEDQAERFDQALRSVAGLQEKS